MRGATGKTVPYAEYKRVFLLTHLMRGATWAVEAAQVDSVISTHAPHARCNKILSAGLTLLGQFLLTHLMRGATDFNLIVSSFRAISTHAPHARCNLPAAVVPSKNSNFYSRTSCEVQLQSQSNIANVLDFYSRTSCEVQHTVIILSVARLLFLLTHLMRGAT